MARLIVVVFLIIGNFSLNYALAENTLNKGKDLKQSYQKIESQFEKLKANKKADNKDFDDLQKKYTSFNVKVVECIKEKTKSTEELKSSLELIGKDNLSKDTYSKPDYINLSNSVKKSSTELNHCKLLKIKINKLINDTSIFRKKELRKQLSSQGMSFFDASKKLFNLQSSDSDIINNLAPTLLKSIKDIATWELFLLQIFGLFIGFVIRQRTIKNTSINSKSHSSPSFIAAIRGIKLASPSLLVLLLTLFYLILHRNNQILFIKIIEFILILVFSYSVIHGVQSQIAFFLSASKKFKYKLSIAAWIILITSTVISILEQNILASYSDSSFLYFIWYLNLLVGSLAQVFILRLLLKKVSFAPLLLILIGVNVVAILAAFLGYRNLANLIYFGFIFSFLVISLSLILLKISTEFFNSLDKGGTQWQYNLRQTLGIKKGHVFPGVIWLRLFNFFIILFICVSALLFIWSNSHHYISTLILIFNNSLPLDSINLSLLNISYALLVMMATFSLMPFIKKVLIFNWLKHSELKQGAKDAAETLLGYIGIAIAFLVAMNILGISSKNMTIMAGALSVGIGFGLKNIVNNFVSGLILLFERPVSNGDWVKIGDTEGYIKNISIRSTTIQTFNRSNVIMPNSELVSHQVTNYMLHNRIGRIVVPIGVVYGSDIENTMKILKSIASKHPDAIINDRDYLISAILLGFENTILNFELRFYIKNINNRVSVKSDIYCEIEHEFNKNNIEVPYRIKTIIDYVRPSHE